MYINENFILLTSNLGFFKTHFYESWILGQWYLKGH